MEGWDFTVRKGHPLNPENVELALPAASKRLAEAGLPILAFTGETDLLYLDTPYAEPLLRAMDAADVRLLKLGHFLFDPGKQQYWQAVDNVRRALEGWQQIARRYHVKVAYHTHSGMG